MKIRSRITYTFTILFGILILSICLIVYFLSYNSTKELFFNRLAERIEISEQFLLENDRFSDSQKEEVKNSFLRSLPNEIEYALSLEDFYIPSDIEALLPNDFKNSLLSSREMRWTHEELQGMARIYEVGNVEYAVIVIATDEFGNKFLSSLALILTFSSLLALVVIYLLSYYFSKNVLKPIAGKINKANNISASNLDMRLTVYNKNDELGMLALSFNNLLDRLQVAFELEKNFVKYVSHEMKNPLAIILGEAEVTLMKQRTPNEYLNSIEKMSNQAEKLNVLVEHFLKLSKLESNSFSKKSINLEDILIEVIFNVSHSTEYQINFTIAEDFEAEDFLISGDQTLISNAISNILENACKFSPNDTSIEVHLFKNKEHIKISVKDHGIGIPEHQFNHIFEPLFRAENAQKIEGTGLGLALVKRIIEVHGGKIDINSKPQVGSEFILSLPKN